MRNKSVLLELDKEKVELHKLEEEVSFLRSKSPEMHDVEYCDSEHVLSKVQSIELSSEYNVCNSELQDDINSETCDKLHDNKHVNLDSMVHDLDRKYLPSNLVEYAILLAMEMESKRHKLLSLGSMLLRSLALRGHSMTLSKTSEKSKNMLPACVVSRTNHCRLSSHLGGSI